MAEYQNAIQIAAQTNHQKPPWIETQCSPPEDLSNTTQRAMDVYLMSKRPNGQMGGIGWWQSANGYTAMALRDLWSGEKRNYETLSNAFRQCESQKRGLINVFNDDTLWWAMCCIHMYSIGGDSWFLNTAKGIWEHIRSGSSVCGRKQVFFQDQDMEGAVYWTTKPHEDQINSITSGLFAELSARLALIEINKQKEHHHLGGLLHHKETTAGEYIEAARCSLGWVLRCRYRPREAVVLDHIKLSLNKAVDWTFTYNTGVALGSCALLYEATREEEYMTLACHMAHKAMRHKGWVEENGVLTEKGSYGRGTHDPAKDNDSVGFKAVLMRQLCTVYDVVKRTSCAMPQAIDEAEMIKTFVNINFESQQERNTNGRGQYGPWWNGPFEMPTSHSQMAVLDVMAAAMLVNRC